MAWIIANWWWISWVLSIVVIPAGLGALKIVAKKTETVKDDRVVTLLSEWWSASKGLIKKK